MDDRDLTDVLQEGVRAAAASSTPLRLQGHDSKAFLGNPVDGDPLDLSAHRGVVRYEPTELVITARGGTPLAEVEAALAENRQTLGFEPPHFGGRGTLGGAVASGLGGPARPWGGAPRDLLLGVRLLDGRGQVLRFGGEVMKNVAGYDVSRLMAGALGTLGILLEISLKVLPAPVNTATQVLALSRDAALAKMRELARQPAPLSGACHVDGRLYLRLSGAEASVRAWQQRIGGETLAPHNTFWQRLRDQELEFFDRPDATLWRLSLAPATSRLACEDEVLLDWGGAQRWVFTDLPAEQVRKMVAVHGGHAEVFRRAPDETAPFQVLEPGLLTLHRRLKERFDPAGIFNPGRLFQGWLS
ncbi:MAG: glycolate oxidase subunit GlcE [Gammaproteobacteria bacterium]|nr:MAG: glycolate oxidase subunit GlcE [Gammaproteobacteria bacterium]